MTAGGGLTWLPAEEKLCLLWSLACGGIGSWFALKGFKEGEDLWSALLPGVLVDAVAEVERVGAASSHDEYG